MNQKISVFCARLLIAGLLTQFLFACSPKEPVRVGFVAGLTGPNAALGVDGRDGAQLAADMINDAGGINGRPLELVVRDDLGLPEGALAADDDLINREQVVAVIGHMTSGTMMSAWSQFKDSGTIFLSPTVSTPQLAGMDDHFFRLIVVNSFVADRVATYAAKDLGLKKVVTFYDTDNAAYTDTYQQEFARMFSMLGGEIVATYPFSSKTAPDFKPLLLESQALQPDGLFIVASAADTALIAQRARIEGMNAQLLATNWSLTKDLIKNGGAAVEGIVAVVSHDDNNQSAEYLDFSRRFQTRYGRAPTFAAGYGYEAAQALAAALRKTDGKKDGLADALLQIKNFRGAHGVFSFDEYGDVSRTLYMIAVRDGKFVTAQIFPAP